jgi:hypothetical protein
MMHNTTPFKVPKPKRVKMARERAVRGPFDRPVLLCAKSFITVDFYENMLIYG